MNSRTIRSGVVDVDEEMDGLLNQLGDKSPSPKFVSSLRERLIAEAERYEDSKPNEHEPSLLAPVTTLAVAPKDNEPQSGVGVLARVLGRVAAAAAVVLGVAALSPGGRTITLESMRSPVDFIFMTEEQPVPVVDRTPTELTPGRYRVDSFNNGFEFEIDEPISVLENSNGIFQFRRAAGEHTERTITITTVTNLADPQNPFVPIDESDQLWPTDDLFGWLDELSESLPIFVHGPADMGGENATRFFVLGSADECIDDELCAVLARSESGSVFGVSTGEVVGVWFLDRGDQDPVVAFVTREHDFPVWATNAESMLASLEFDDE